MNVYASMSIVLAALAFGFVLVTHKVTEQETLTVPDFVDVGVVAIVGAGAAWVVCWLAGLT